MIRSLQLCANRVARQVQVSTTATYTSSKIFEWLNARYRRVYNAQFWPKTIDFYSVTLNSNVSNLVLPKKIGSVLRIVNTTTNETVYLIDPAAYSDKTISLRNVFRIFLESILQNETPVGTALGVSNVLNQLTAAGVVKISSSAAGDTSGKVYVRGLDANGDVVQDTISLNGVTVVAGTTSFTTVDAISKTVSTTGIVTITDSAGTLTIATIAPWEVSPEYQRVRLEVVETQSCSLSVCAQRNFVPMLNTADVPAFDCEDVIVHGATADAWLEQGDLAKSQIEEGNFQQEMKNLTRQFLEKGSNAVLMLPSGRS